MRTEKPRGSSFYRLRTQIFDTRCAKVVSDKGEVCRPSKVRVITHPSTEKNFEHLSNIKKKKLKLPKT